jgi:catechol 2,3-dioxygenase-like lactoylglutathione lyase family enzyme
MRIDHINIRAPEDLLEAVKDFYCGVFGLTNGFRPEFRQQGYWLYAGDKALVHLSRDESPGEVGDKGYLDHVAFQSSDLDAFRDNLNSFAIDFRVGYIREPEMTQLFFSDPAGTGLEVNFPGER